MHVLPVEGGWSAVLRIPNTESDEDFALRLIERDGVVVHPGYFFDFETDGHLVLSLLTEPRIFDEGVRRLLSAVPR
jgi:aspartate/methionine/tyrosine aminotransferase